MRNPVFLREVNWVDRPDENDYPFNLPAFAGVERLRFSHSVTFFAGENGSGKSTLLEALALACGMNGEGGGRNNRFGEAESESPLHRHLRLSWLPKVTQGFFFRSESFFNFATYLERMEAAPEIKYRAYGGRSLHQQSHGEAFLALFSHRLNARSPALFLLDEPEAALSPVAQMAFLRILDRLVQNGNSQFVIATHSPILMALPNAQVWDLDRHPLKPVAYTETSAYRVTRAFLEAPERMLSHLREEDEP